MIIYWVGKVDFISGRFYSLLYNGYAKLLLYVSYVLYIIYNSFTKLMK
jgi:hypothetical protein